MSLCRLLVLFVSLFGLSLVGASVAGSTRIDCVMEPCGPQPPEDEWIGSSDPNAVPGGTEDDPEPWEAPPPEVTGVDGGPEDPEPPPPSQSLVPPDGGSGVHIDRQAIRDYALQYAGTHTGEGATDSAGYNPNYRVYRGTDCQNFVSQALRAGQWLFYPTFSRNQQNPRHWYYDFSNQADVSLSWFAVRYFWRYAQFSNRGRYLRGWRHIELGDVVLLDGNGKLEPPAQRKPTHSMIVTRIDGVVGDPGWDVRLTYHSFNMRNKSLHELFAKYPNGTFWIFNLYDFYATNPNESS